MFFFKCSFFVSIPLLNIDKQKVIPSEKNPFLIHLVILGQLMLMINNDMPFLEFSTNQLILFQEIEEDNNDINKTIENFTETDTNPIFEAIINKSPLEINQNNNIFKKKLSKLIESSKNALSYIEMYADKTKINLPSYLSDTTVLQKIRKVFENQRELIKNYDYQSIDRNEEIYEINYGHMKKTISPINYEIRNNYSKIAICLSSIAVIARIIIAIALLKILIKQNKLININDSIITQVLLIHNYSFQDLKTPMKYVVFKNNNNIMKLPMDTFVFLYSHGFNKIEDNQESSNLPIHIKILHIEEHLAKHVTIFDLRQVININKLCKQLHTEICSILKDLKIFPVIPLTEIRNFITLEFNQILKEAVKDLINIEKSKKQGQ